MKYLIIITMLLTLTSCLLEPKYTDQKLVESACQLGGLLGITSMNSELKSKTKNSIDYNKVE